MPGRNKWKQPRQQAQQVTQQTQQPQQVATRQASVPLTNVNNLGFPDDAYINVGESIDLVGAFFADFGLDRELNLDEIESHLAMVKDHEQRIQDLETKVSNLERGLQTQAQAAASQAQATPQVAQQQATPQAQAATPQAQVTQQAAAQAQATQLGGGVRIEHMYRSRNFVAYDEDDAKQTAKCLDDPTKVRCFVNDLHQAAELTPEQMIVFGYSHIVTTTN